MLNGWKEIAAYIGREQRTAVRWAVDRRMPVHRAPGQGRGTVYALPDEIDLWLAEDRARVARSTRTVSSSPTITEVVRAPIAALFSAERWRRRRRRVGAMIGGGAALAVIGALTLHRAMPVVTAVHRGGSDPIARDLYLRGRAAWSRRTPSSLAEATSLFGDAVARDPRMADAYVGLADAWLLRREFAAVPEAEAFTRADAATEAALAIDPKLPGAVRTRGFIDFWWQRNAGKGLAELREAVVLAPNDAQSHHWLATALGTTNDDDGALREFDAARALDPANPAILTDRGSMLVKAGRVADGLAALREVVAAYPLQSDAHASLASTMLKMGNVAAYAREWQAAAALRGETAKARLYGEAVDAFSPGAASYAKRLVARWAEAACGAGWLPPSEAARLVSLAGDRAGARAILDTPAANREPMTLIAPLVPL